MITITTAPLSFKANRILRILHPFDEHNATVRIEAQHMKGSMTTVKIGQTIVDKNLIYASNIIILHSCSDKLLKGYLDKLRPWVEILKMFKNDSNRYLIVYGNAMSILSDKIFYVPQGDNIIINQIQRSPMIDVDTEGLGLINFWCTEIINIKKLGNNFRRNLNYLSKSKRIFLLESGTVIDNTGKVTFGNLYQALDGKLMTIKELPAPETPEDVETIHDRKIPPIRAIYAEEETVAETPDNTEVKET